ncbi:MAG: coagulation factor 5/8 type domain protein [Pedosphaera sp.]|nr:coagulation factor 5/8 type domain protein [Pedosphaera sp.]
MDSKNHDMSCIGDEASKQWIRASNLLLYSACIVACLFFCVGNTAHATVGAVTPFISYEAESGTLAGGAAVVSLTSAPTTQYSSPVLEASGHAYVQLTATGQSVTWTNISGQNFTAINLRSCIPDAPAGGGITNTIDLYVNGVFRQAFSVNSLQNYCYEGTNYNGQADKNPADGNPRGFWNDTHAFISGAAVAPGDTIKFQMDSSNTASFYYIDVVDFEAPPAPLAQPTNSLSILSYGAISNDITADNTTAINTCFSDAQTQGKTAWIPPGTFYFSAVHGGLNASGITIQGAGAWYSTLYRVTPAGNSQGVANIITTTSSTLRNVSLDCNASSRAGNNNNGAVNFSGNNWLVDNVWIQHVTSAFWCAGVGGTAQNCRVLSVWSDGGNFNNVQSANGIGMNLTYSNNFVRGTGDDAMAINSVNYNVFGNTTYYYTIMSNITYINNTAVGAWGGKGIGIYGGVNDVVTNNLLRDTARYIGLGVGKFGVNGSDLLSATVTGNTVLRCGGNGYLQQQQAMMIGNSGDGQGVGAVVNAYCANNTIINSLYSAVGFSTSSNIVFQYNTIINPGLDGIVVGPPYVGAGVVGNAIINSNTVTGLSAGRSAFTSGASGYAAIIPIAAASHNSMSGVATETCSEGGQDISNIANGDWSAYNGVNLTGANIFVARVASAGAGGIIQIHLDSPSGTLVGTCSVSGTGGWQTYSNVYCNLSGASGTHNVYLVYVGGNGALFNVQLFGFYSAGPALSHQLIAGNTYSLKALANGKYVTAANGGTNALIAQSAAVGTAEQFNIIDMGGGNVALQSLVNAQYVCADNNGASPLIANRASPGSWETFTEFVAGNGNIALRAMNNGEFVTVPNGGASPLIAQSTTIGSAESFTVGFVSGVTPAVPANLIATAGNSQVSLNWLGSPGATGYNVKYSTNSGGPYTVIGTNLAGTSFVHTGLVNGTTYYYVVSAMNLSGESANSSQVIATPGTLNRTLWIASSSTSGSDAPANALDGNLTTRWSTGGAQVSGQWFRVDMGAASTFNKIVLNCVNSANDYPRGYQVTVSNDGISWSNPVATGTGSSSITTISFATQAARYIRITQTGSTSGTFWSIDEFNVFGTAPTVPANPTATAISSSEVNLSWNASVSASGYNLKRSTTSNGTYVTIATNLPYLNYSDTGLAAGTTYYYVVTAMNPFGESAASVSVSAQPVSMTPPQLNFGIVGKQLQIIWPQDHQGWKLQTQTNAPGSGLGTNWVNMAGSEITNQMTVPVDPVQGSVFFRLVHP